MQAKKILQDIYWVGGIDWNLRSFHGYLTQRGSTYNSYLIIDEKIVLVDTVKHYLYDEMLERIKEIVDPEKIDYIITNHVEMDHSGSLPKILDVAKKAVVVTSPNGEKGLKKHYNGEWKYKIVNTGDSLNIGRRNLRFILAPMVHWPDSMVTYAAEDKLLLPNDAFGQHMASSERFDDELDFGIIREEAAKYYANIVLPYGSQVNKLFEAAAGLDIEMIAPSHGVIWRKHIKEIMELYNKWANNICEDTAVIAYDSMWGSTEKMARVLSEIFTEAGIICKLRNLAFTDISDVMTDVLTAKYICVGSPTLNNGMMPTVSAFLTYLKGLAPKNRIGLAFGSYGWGGQSISDIENILEASNFALAIKGLRLQYVPKEDDLKNFKNRIKAAYLNGRA